MRILLIEDDDAIREVIQRGLEEDRYYLVDTAANGATGLKMALDEEYGLVILDIMLPGMDGWQICAELRSRRRSMPILMLTARDSVHDRVRGLDTGADDYLTKPFEFDELFARVRALLRRDKQVKSRVLRIGWLEIDTGAHSVSNDGVEVALTPREYSLLETLALHEGHIVSRDTIQYQIWNNEECSSNTVDVYIKGLRKKIDVDQSTKLIHTIHGLGYMLKRPQHEEVS